MSLHPFYVEWLRNNSLHADEICKLLGEMNPQELETLYLRADEDYNTFGSLDVASLRFIMERSLSPLGIHREELLGSVITTYESMLMDIQFPEDYFLDLVKDRLFRKKPSMFAMHGASMAKVRFQVESFR